MFRQQINKILRLKQTLSQFCDKQFCFVTTYHQNKDVEFEIALNVNSRINCFHHKILESQDWLEPVYFCSLTIALSIQKIAHFAFHLH